MAKEKKERSASSFSRPVRILALILSILVTGTVITVLIQLLMNLFGA